MLADRRYVLYLLAVSVNIAVYTQYISTLPLAMADAGAATIWYSSAIALNGLVVICCELLLTKLTQRLPLALVVSVGFGLLAVGQLVYALPWGVGVFIVGTLIWTIAEITAGPTMASYPGRAAPPGCAAVTSPQCRPCSTWAPRSGRCSASPSTGPSAARCGCGAPPAARWASRWRWPACGSRRPNTEQEGAAP